MAAKRPIPTDMPFWTFSSEADRDYLLARLINTLGGGFNSRAGYFGHQACEKYLKAVSVQAFGNYLPIHALKYLAQHLASVDPYFSDSRTLEVLAFFDVYEEVGRYGGAAKKDPWAVSSSGFEFRGVHVWTNQSINQLDEFVARTRGLLKFVPGGFVDTLKAIHDGMATEMLQNTWKGPLPLREVLMNGNQFYRPS